MNRVKYYRKKADLTQEELAKMANITQSAICGYEGQKRQPNCESLLALSRCLDVSPFELAGEDYPELAELKANINVHIQTAKDILDWWSQNHEIVEKLTTLSIRRYGVTELPLRTLLEKIS